SKADRSVRPCVGGEGGMCIGRAGGMAMHTRRSFPPTAREWSIGGRWTRNWWSCVGDILHLPKEKRTEQLSQQIRDRIPLRPGGCGLGNRACAENTPLRHAQGIASAVPTLASILRKPG